MNALTAHGSGLPAWWGRFPLGVPFARSKGTKTRLGRSPLRTSLGYEAGPASSLDSARHPCCGPCHCHHTKFPWATGPMAGWFPCPGLPWRSGVPTAGSHRRTSFGRGRGRACRARWFSGSALEHSGGASPSPTPGNSKNTPMLELFCVFTNSRFSAPPPAAACQPFGRRRPWWQTPPGTRSDRRCPGESRALGRGGDSLGRWRQR